MSDVQKLDMGEVSDGYHTFNELYHHRAVLFAVICNQNPGHAWKSKKHFDGSMYDGMFIVGLNTPFGPVTYHYDIDPYWNMFCVAEKDYADVWDGSTSDDCVKRLEKFAELERIQVREGVKYVNGVPEKDL